MKHLIPLCLILIACGGMSYNHDNHTPVVWLVKTTGVDRHGEFEAFQLRWNQPLNATHSVVVVLKQYALQNDRSFAQRHESRLFVFAPGSTRSPAIPILHGTYWSYNVESVFTVEIVPPSSEPILNESVRTRLDGEYTDNVSRDAPARSIFHVFTATDYEVGKPSKLVFGDIPAIERPWEDTE